MDSDQLTFELVEIDDSDASAKNWSNPVFVTKGVAHEYADVASFLSDLNKDLGERTGRRTLCVHGFEIPFPLRRFAAAIESAWPMLDLSDDWDDEGSPGYEEHTLRTAIDIALRAAEKYLELHGEAPQTPAFVKAPEGGVDVVWWSGTKRMLISIPRGASESIHFHGFDTDDRRRELKGRLAVGDANAALAEWVME